jgi:hypothetical protein
VEPRERIYRLLYLALVDMRVEAYEAQNSTLFHLADLFHNIPLQMERVANGEGTYSEILSSLQTRAAEKGCLDWLSKAMSG